MANSSLTRTVTASSATSYTVSFWLKINNPNYGSTPYLWSIGSTNGNGIYLFDSDRKIYFFKQSTSSFLNLYNGALRDTSAWYHVVWSVNSGTGTAYINGITGNSHSSIPALNDNTGTKISIHDYVGGGYNALDCLIANFYFIDGQALTSSSFGQTDATTGIWKPKGYSGSYGTNGFFLKFENSGSLGTDSSGNGNNFTVNGTPTQTVDTPSNVFTTLNSLNVTPSGGHTFSNGNTQVTIGAVDAATPATFGVKSGKWYWETKWTQKGGTDRYGVMPDDASNQTAPHVTGIAWNEGSAEMWLLSSSYSGSWGSNPATNDIIMFALDYDNKAFYMGVNGTWRNSGVPTSGASRTGAVNFSSTSLDGKYLLPAIGKGNGGTSTWQMNFGNGYFGSTAITSPVSDTAGLGKFQYTVPAGYYSLCTKNINVYG